MAARLTIPEAHGAALRRDPDAGLVAGVCAGIAAQLGFDVALVRIAFVALTFAGGIGIVAYALMWAFVPVRGGAPALSAPRLGRHGGLEVGIGTGLVVLALLLAARALGIWWSDAVVWPLVGLAAGSALLWRGVTVVDRTASDAVVRDGPPREEPAAAASRTGLGVALVVSAGLVFLGVTGTFSAARDVLLSVMVVAVVLGVIFGPWIVRLGRSLAAERSERIRSEERAELSAHLHDSVLQTLALVQQRSGDPRAVEVLARRQERELRAWLGRRSAPGGDARLGSALEEAAGEVERDHGVRVEVVTVGDTELDDRSRALVAAAREAMVNAAKFGGGSPVDVFAEAGGDDLQVYVRDRGPGFDPDQVGPDRRGVRESIVGRMQRHGGRAVISSQAGEGTEVELTLPVRGG